DKLFMGTDGFIPQVGFTCSDMSRAEAMRNLAESARKVMILTDSTKFEQQGVVLQMRFDKIHTVFTDEGAPESARKKLQKNHVELVLV
ncbi:MAG: DeoR/GlpR transcriptional regulator, partial [Lachnospiraceae bacterium]|nr:DeoR/GlpR transcriptional regulator [Lachnospiraceae bacterium]